MYEHRCDERLKDEEDEGSTHLGYTGWCGGLEHLKIETRFIDESFVSVMGESGIYRLFPPFYVVYCIDSRIKKGEHRG
jgi:hypothetical protein